MKLMLERETVTHPRGLEIGVSGFPGDGAKSPCQVFIEVYQGVLQIHVWDGTQEDPVASVKIKANKGQDHWWENSTIGG